MAVDLNTVGNGLMVVKLTQLRENSSALERQIGGLTQLNARFTALLGRMEASWEGAASEAYLRLMQQYAAQAADIVLVLQEFKSYVDRAVSAFEEADNSAASRILGSF